MAVSWYDQFAPVKTSACLAFFCIGPAAAPEFPAFLAKNACGRGAYREANKTLLRSRADRDAYIFAILMAATLADSI